MPLSFAMNTTHKKVHDEQLCSTYTSITEPYRVWNVSDTRVEHTCHVHLSICYVSTCRVHFNIVVSVQYRWTITFLFLVAGGLGKERKRKKGKGKKDWKRKKKDDVGSHVIWWILKRWFGGYFHTMLNYKALHLFWYSKELQNTVI